MQPESEHQWKLVSWKEHRIRPHLVPTELVGALIAEMAVRAPDDAHESTKEQYEDGINMPGSCFVDRPDEVLDLDGIKLFIPCEDVREILTRLERLPTRLFGDVVYYKLHSFLRCTVLTPAHRSTLIETLRERLPAAEARSDEFYRARSTLVRSQPIVAVALPVNDGDNFDPDEMPF